MAARSITGPLTLPVRWPSTTSSAFARVRVMPKDAARGRTISMNPPETSPTGHPRASSSSISSRAPGDGSTAASTSASTDSGRPASVATRSCSDAAKSISPRIARSVISVTSTSEPACAASSSTTSPVMNVESTSMTTRWGS